jgi:hypothetical protein
MSEYQYYEFLAIDRPLTEGEMAELRALSTRAVITSVSFTNHYNWGDFKGDPNKLMEHYFDAHIYVANWMTAIFMLRLPIEVLNKEMVKTISIPYVLDFKAVNNHWIITWGLNESENYDRFGMEDGSGWMMRLAPVRDELLRGDLRSLYIGWLAAVSRGMIGNDEMEALPVCGLGNLTPAQLALAEFLEVDPDLIAGAGIDSPVDYNEMLSEKNIDRWIKDLPRNEVKELIRQLLEGKGHQAERIIRNRFAATQRALKTDNNNPPGRTVKKLRDNAGKARQVRMEEERRERERLEAGLRKEREAYLKKLSEDFPKVWRSVAKTVKRGSGLAYDEACQMLVDISEAHELFKDKQQFRKELRNFMAGNMRRKALIKRIAAAGIWKDK